MRENIKATVKNILTAYLELNKHRKTPERFTILDAVYSMSGHFSLEELGEKLTNDYNFPVSRATLYNTLRLLIELRLVVRHRFQSTTKYEACYDNNSHCHQICTVCGKVTEVKSHQVSEAINSMPMRRFHKDGYTLYVYGICSSCQMKLRRHSTKGKETKKLQKQNKNNNESR
jgi:Fur family ferric uptake transcriptional regulator